MHADTPIVVTLQRRSEDLQRRFEARLFLLYFGGYLTYLFLTPETELGHWASLVALPALALFLLRGRGGRAGLAASAGLAPRSLGRGLAWAVPLGLALGALQLLVSRDRDAIYGILSSGRVAYLLPLVFGLMMLTAASTEEFFFRGVLQTRLAALTRSRIAAIIVTSVLFGLFHWPYAYLIPQWPSRGDAWAAFQAAMVVGLIGGVVLGLVYELSGRNLLASAIVHALINAVPGMTQLRL